MYQIFSKYKSYSEMKFTSFVDKDDALSVWQARFFGNIMLYLLPLSFVFYIPNVIMCFKDDFYLLAIIDTLAVLMMPFLYFNNKMSFKTRTALFIGTLYVLGLLLVYYLGWSGPGFVYLLVISAFSALIHSQKAGFITFTANISIFLVIFLLSGFDIWKIDNFTFLDTRSMIVISTNFIMMNFVLVVGIASLSKGLQSTINTEINIRKQLEISNRKHYDALISAQESQLFNRKVNELLPLPFFFKDLQGRYLAINQSFKEFFKVTEQNIIGRSIFDIQPLEIAQMINAKNNDVLRKIDTQIYETQLHTPYGVRNVIIHNKTLSNSKNEIIGLLGTIVDITEIRYAEQKIRELNESLEKKVNDRTSDLKNALMMIEESNKKLKNLNSNLEAETNKLLQLNDRLKKSEKELQEANTTKDKFLSIISHDLRNPVSALYMNLELLEFYFDNFNIEEIKEKISKLYQTSSSLKDMVANLLQWASAQANRIEYQPEKIFVNGVIESTVKLLENNSEAKNIDIEFNNKSNQMYVYADPHMLDTIVRNLLSNAIKFTPKGGKIELGYIDDADNKYLTLFVKDNGIGMSREMISNLFRIDVNISILGTSKEAGSGIGLILCKEFVSHHNGQIWVDSEIGKGSTFFFTIPKIQPD